MQASLESSRSAVRKGVDVEAQRLVERLAPLMDSEDVKEGVQSFLERRAANFQGR